MGYILQKYSRVIPEPTEVGGGYISQKYRPPISADAPIQETWEQIEKYRADLMKEGIEPPKAKGVLGTVNKILDVLRTGEYAVGGILAGKGPITGIKEKISPSEVIGITPKETKTVWGLLKQPAFYGALAVDTLLDPITYLTFGFGAGTKIPTKVGTKVLNKEGKKLLQKAVKQFREDAGRRMVATRILREGGEKYLAKGGLKFMGFEILPREVVQAPFKKIDLMLERLPFTGIPYKKTKELVGKAFKPFRDVNQLPAEMGGSGRFEEMVLKTQKGIRGEARRRLQYIAELAKEAKRAGIKDAGRQITALVELDLRSGNKVLDDIADWMQESMKQIGFAEKKRGILPPEVPVELPGYMRRFLTEEGRKFLEKGGKKVQTEFIDNIKRFRVRAPFAKKRKLIRIVSEDGKDVTWDVAKYSLKPFKKAKVIERLKQITEKKIKALEEMQRKLLSKEIEIAVRPWREHIEFLKTQVSTDPTVTRLVKQVDEFNQKQFSRILKRFIDIENKKLAKVINELEEMIKFGGGKEFLYRPTQEVVRFSKEAKVVELQKKINALKKEMAELIKKYSTFDFVDDEGKFYKAVTKGEFKGFKPLTISEINKFYKEKYGVKLFEEDAFKAFAQRTVEHIKAVRMYDFFKTVAEEFGIQAPKAPTIVKRIGRPAEMVNKRITETVIDGVKYVDTKIPQLEGFLVPEPIAKHLNMTYQFLTNDEVAKGILGLYDKLLRLWKGTVTGWFPAFHTRNFIGGLFNNWLAGLTNPKWYIEGDALARGKNLNKIYTTALGEKVAGSQIIREIEDLGVVGAPGMIDVMRNLEEMVRVGKVSRIKEISEYPRVAMEVVEDRLRIPLYLYRRIAKGDSAEEAAKYVFRFHFDYAPEAFTPFERNVMRRIIPFYTWTRNNVPLQIAQLARQPGKYAFLEKFRRTFEKASGEKAVEEREYLPAWMKEMFLFRLPGESKEGLPRYLQLDLPIEDLNKLPFTESGRREIIALLSPFIKYPIERIANRNLYFGSEIFRADMPREYQTAKTIEALKYLPEPIKKYLNFKEVKIRNVRTGEWVTRYEMDAIKLHAIRSVLAGRFYSTVASATDSELDAWMKLSRVLGGVPIRPVDIEEEKYRRLKEQERILRNVESYLKRRGVIPYKTKKIKPPTVGEGGFIFKKYAPYIK